MPFDGRVAIGEGERDDAPMLWIGEPLGSMQGNPNAPSIDIAVDPLECTNHVAKDLPNAMAVLAAAPRGTPVSYTHLTLSTTPTVCVSVVAASINTKTPSAIDHTGDA